MHSFTGNVGVIMAFKKEAQPLLDGGFNLIKDFPFRVFNGLLGNINIYLGLSGLGKARAAACTQYLLNNYDLDFIINAGSCGGVCPLIKIGDIIFASCCVEYDFKSIREGTPVLPTEIFFHQKATILNIKPVVLGSADNNADTKEKKENLHKMGIHVADWEGAAIVKTCRINKKKAAILKVVTDTSTKEFEKEFFQNLTPMSEKLANTVRCFIKECYN